MTISQTQYRSEPRFPFTAIVGQTAMKRALILNAINTRIGGVLIRGKKGTAKSTAVRSLAALLPEVEVVRGCPYSCHPDNPQPLCSHGKETSPVTRQVRIVDLPVGATEDRLVGSLDIEAAIRTGSRSFEPGLIAATHRGILYVDEVNLLNDHLVDVLLDAAAMGRNYVEREGISVSHAAEFILVGTMNPEEGDLRPQLLDRFGLAVEVDGAFTPEERREVVKRRIAYESDPFGFMDAWEESEASERERILRSQQLLGRVAVSDDMLELITDICAEYQVDGLRADIVMYKTAGTIAAYEGRDHVVPEDVREAAEMALLHRQRRQPFQQPHLATEQLDSMIDEFQNRPAGPGATATRTSRSPRSRTTETLTHRIRTNSRRSRPAIPGPQDQYFEVGNPFSVTIVAGKAARPPGPALGRPSAPAPSAALPSGRYVGVPPCPQENGLRSGSRCYAAGPPLLGRSQRRSHARALDPRPVSQRRRLLMPPPSSSSHGTCEEKVRETKTGSLILFVVDASGSMGAQRRMVAVKGAILSLLLDAYQRRDRVGLIAFRGTGAQVLLPPTSSVDLAHAMLQEMPTGGRTPLSRGLLLAMEVIEAEKTEGPEHTALCLWCSPTGGPMWPWVAARVPPSGSQWLHRAAGLPLAEARAMAAAIREQKTLGGGDRYGNGLLAAGAWLVPVAEEMGAPCLKLEELHADGPGRRGAAFRVATTGDVSR